MAKAARDKKLPLVGHLEELRRRLIYIIVIVFLATAFTYFYVEIIIDYMTRAIDALVFIHPLEAFMVRLKAALIAGIFLALPFILYHVWRFISVGLTKKERRGILLYLPVSFLIFIGGASFAYFIVLPLGIKFLLSFASPTLTPTISINAYFSLALWMLLVFGTVFELPIVILFFSRLGLITPNFLRRNRKFAIVIIFIAAAILTPPDVFTQLLLGIPIILLYEISIILAQIAYRKRQK